MLKYKETNDSFDCEERKCIEIQSMLKEKNYTKAQLQYEQTRNTEMNTKYKEYQNKINKIENIIDATDSTYKSGAGECIKQHAYLKELMAKYKMQANEIINIIQGIVTLKDDFPLISAKIEDYKKEQGQQLANAEKYYTQIQAEINKLNISYNQSSETLSKQYSNNNLHFAKSMELMEMLNQQISKKSENELTIVTKIKALKTTSEQLLVDITEHGQILEQSTNTKISQVGTLQKNCVQIEASMQSNAECLKTVITQINTITVDFNIKMNGELERVTDSIRNSFLAIQQKELADIDNAQAEGKM